MGTKSGGWEYSVQALPLYLDGSYRFWYTIGLLQFLHECSGLLQQERVLDGQEARGHKIPVESFTLEGINKCDPRVEWRHWEDAGRQCSTCDVLRTPTFHCSSSF